MEDEAMAKGESLPSILWESTHKAVMESEPSVTITTEETFTRGERLWLSLTIRHSLGWLWPPVVQTFRQTFQNRN